MDEGFAIPAATVQDVDLSAANTALASEIRRLGDLMERGEETPEEFSRLVQSLVKAGQPEKAEYLLRRNLEVAAGELALYRELFGTAKPDEFAGAIESFAGQFGVGLASLVREGFLSAAYRLRPSQPRTDAFALLAAPCEVRFDYAEPDYVTADVSSEVDERYLMLRWVRGMWELVE